MSNYENSLAREWDREDFSDFSDEYLEWCEENGVEPNLDHYNEWMDDREGERLFEESRDR